jgi:hypothetical protein
MPLQEIAYRNSADKRRDVFRWVGKVLSVSDVRTALLIGKQHTTPHGDDTVLTHRREAARGFKHVVLTQRYW